MKPLCLALAGILGAPLMATAQQSNDPSVSQWLRNLDGTSGQGGTPAIHAAVSQIQADVQGVLSTPLHVFVRATGVPNHSVGPFGGNPGMPGDQAGVYRIPRNPTEELGPKTESPLGSIGVLVNGVAIFNALDAMSF